LRGAWFTAPFNSIIAKTPRNSTATESGVLKDRQKSSLQEAAMQTIQLQRLLNPPDVIDVDSTPIAG
jgi:hypothetical protein